MEEYGEAILKSITKELFVKDQKLLNNAFEALDDLMKLS